MIERYTLPEMGRIWSEEVKFRSWLDVEIAATEAQWELGRVPTEALATIRHKAAFEVERILEIEAEVRHDVIAFLTNAKRKTIVEPVFGQTKEARGLRQFLLRGLTKVNGEWLLWGMTHNINKLWRHFKRQRHQEAMATG